MGEATEIRKTLDRIADCLERIEKTLPGYNQEALREAVEKEVKRIFTALFICSYSRIVQIATGTASLQMVCTNPAVSSGYKCCKGWF